MTHGMSKSETVPQFAKKQAGRDRLASRLWLGLLATLLALAADEPSPLPEDPWQPGLADLLDKIGAIIGRAFCRLEAKLGLQPKNWPPDARL